MLKYTFNCFPSLQQSVANRTPPTQSFPNLARPIKTTKRFDTESIKITVYPVSYSSESVHNTVPCTVLKNQNWSLVTTNDLLESVVSESVNNSDSVSGKQNNKPRIKCLENNHNEKM